MKPVPARTERGFTLLELSIVLIIISVVTGMAVSSGIGVITAARQSATQSKMKAIDNALLQFRTTNDRIPCPSDLTLAPGSADYGLEAGADAGSAIAVGTGVCTGAGMLPQANFTAAGGTNTFATGAEGALPAVTLGLAPDFMVDGWGNKFRYVVDISMTTNAAFVTTPAGCIDGAITINDMNGNARSANTVYALISSGANGHGAYTKNGIVTNAGSTNTSEQTNCHCNSTATVTAYAPTYVQRAPYVNSASATDTFDDLVIYKERWQMQTTWDSVASCSYIYVAECYNNRVQKLTTSGGFIMGVGAGYNGVAGSIASSGTANGQFNCANGLAVDTSGNIWVSDYTNNRVEKFNSSGTFLLGIGAGYQGVSGSVGSTGSGNGQFNVPNGIAIDASGNAWVADFNNFRIEEFNSSGTFLSKITSSAGLNSPVGVAIDSGGNIWSFNYNIWSWLQECTSAGVCNHYGGGCNNPGGNGQYYCGVPGNSDFVSIDASGNVWVTDESDARVQEFNSSGSYIGQISGLATAGSGGSSATGIAFDASGNIWIANEDTNLIYQYNTSGTLLKTVGSSGSGNGQLHSPQAIVISSR